MSNLIFHVKRKYFDLIKNGEKTVEFRRIIPYWSKRLQGLHEKIIVYNAYTSEKLEFAYTGYGTQTITHVEFGDKPVVVFSIPLVR